MTTQIKTPEEIAGPIVNDWLNEYTWPYSEILEFSATELADAVEGLIAQAVEADRAQRAETAARAAEDATALYSERFWFNYRENQGWEGGDLEHCAEWAARMALGLPVKGRK